VTPVLHALEPGGVSLELTEVRVQSRDIFLNIDVLCDIPIKDVDLMGLQKLGVRQSEEQLGLVHLVDVFDLRPLQLEALVLDEVLVHNLREQLVLLQVVVHVEDQSVLVVAAQLELKSGP
jgi:hypothetical protein